MPTATAELTKSLPSPPWGSLPPRMRVLFVTTHHRTGGWLAEALAGDRASDVSLDEVIGVTAAFGRVRDEQFDALLISHEPDDLDALELIQALRAGGSDEPMLILGAASEQEMVAMAFEVGADAYLCVNTTTTRTLLWVAARAIERHQLLRENRRLIQAERQRLQQEHEEANRLLAEQRALIDDLETLGDADPARAAVAADSYDGLHHPTRPTIVRETLPLPEKLVGHYADLLRAHVIMGSGNLTTEMHVLADLLATAGVTPQQTMLLHLQVVEELIHGLGSRSARHVMTRADLLVLEVMMYLGEGYRERYMERKLPPRQTLLPGFELPDAPSKLGS